jgi:hypothetical protein
VKKLISIGVALALVALVVLPIGAAAQTCDYDGIAPVTFSKIPFAIVQSGFHLVGIILTGAGSTLGLPSWIDAALMDNIGDFAGGPLSWSVDMLGWGLGLVSSILTGLGPTLGLPDFLPAIVGNITCAIFQPFSCNITGTTFTPCG